MADALDRGALHEAEGGRPVEPHVEAALLAEHHRRAAAEDHPRAVGGQAAHAFLAVAAQALVLVAGGRR